MPKDDRTPPAYCHHKGRDLAYVRIDRQFHYLGKYGSPESHVAYAKLIAGWLATGETPEDRDIVTVSGVIAAYKEWADDYYRKDGQPTSQKWLIDRATAKLEDLFGDRPVDSLTPTMLKRVREKLIEQDLARTTINKYVGIIQHTLRWGVEHELVEPATADRVGAVRGLTKGRSKAREPEPRQPVPDELVDATLPHVSRVAAAMIEIQRNSGMRSGEVCLLRWADIDTSGKVWMFRPQHHKTIHHGHTRVIGLGPRCQKALLPFRLEYAGGHRYRPRPADVYLFSPREAQAIRRHERYFASGSVGSGRKRKRPGVLTRKIADRYDPQTYRVNIQRACKRAGIEAWFPHLLRHAFATKLRREGHNLDVIRALLGQRSVVMSEHYAKLDTGTILQVAAVVA